MNKKLKTGFWVLQKRQMHFGMSNNLFQQVGAALRNNLAPEWFLVSTHISLLDHTCTHTHTHTHIHRVHKLVTGNTKFLLISMIQTPDIGLD